MALEDFILIYIYIYYYTTVLRTEQLDLSQKLLLYDKLKFVKDWKLIFN